MDEMNVAQPEVTEVETETSGEAVEQTTETPTQPETQVENETQVADAQSEQGGEGETGEEGNTQEDDFSLQVKYNKQTQNLSREDAVRYAQMGMKFESMQPTFKKLQYLAAADNTTLEKMVDSIVDGIEKAKLQRFEQKANGDEEILEALVQEDKRKAGKAYEEWQEAQRKAEMQEQQDEIKTLAKEFSLCQKQIPELKDAKFSDVPEQVLMIRESENISLFDAYLRFNHSEQIKANKETQHQQENANSSTGSVVSSIGEQESTLPKDLLRSIWGN